MEIRTIESLSVVDGSVWNTLAGTRDPFLTHAFLHGLEQHDCLAPQGWYPRHLLATEAGAVVGALPLYIKDNSYGEFVFDWSWAEAYERAGGRYYPKLVAAIPFTPVMGERILLSSCLREPATTARSLVAAAIGTAEEQGLSSLHCLFPTAAQAAALADHGLLIRKACQYHWFNRGYGCFEDFLAALTSKRRKEIRRERRAVIDAGITVEVRSGCEITAEHWSIFHRFYCSTFERKWGEPRLTESFFNSLSAHLSGCPVLFLGKFNREYVAGAFAMRGGDTLYGRHWGCSGHFPQLHFELCYYQTIDYCIREKLRRLDAGAQGEHKISRGFEPVETWSAHWIRDPRFRTAVHDFLRRERAMVDDYILALNEHSAYRSTSAAVECSGAATR